MEVVRKPKKPVPEKIAELWAAEWAKEGKELDWQSLLRRVVSVSFRGGGLWSAPSHG